MKCSECGYEHDLSAEHWVYLENDSYQIKSSIFDAQILTEIAEHALSLNPQQEAIYIDICHIDTQSCMSCHLQNLKNSKTEIEQKYYERGLVIHYFF